MKKKIIGTVAIVSASAMLLSGCNASSASSAARSADRTAKRSENVAKRMVQYEDKHYNFPKHFEGDFFVTNQNEMQMHGYNFATTPKNRPEVVRANDRYQGRHFDMSSLNQNNASKMAYQNRLDDLYALCADISAANAKQNQLINEIKAENNSIRKTARDLKNHKTARGRKNQHKPNFTQFNDAHDEAQKAIVALHKDRKSMQPEMKRKYKNHAQLQHNVDYMSTRYMTIMNKLDSRVSKLSRVSIALADQRHGEPGQAQRVRTVGLVLLLQPHGS